MKKIQKNILDYILKDVNLTLERLGVSEKVEILEEKEVKGIYYYNFKSKPIKVTPMIYKETIIKGYLYDTDAEEGKGICPMGKRVICVNIDYDFSYFGGGHNGVQLGIIYYNADNNIAEDEKEMNYIVRKIRSLEI